jgi:hypothetical protein
MSNDSDIKKKEAEEVRGVPGWMVTFSDLSTLLLTFFVLLLSMSSMDDRSMKSMFTNFTSACGILYFKEYGEIYRPKEVLIESLYESLQEILTVKRSEDPVVEEASKSKSNVFGKVGGLEIDEFHKDNFIYDDQRDCYICPQGEELFFSHIQKRKNKEPLRIYRCRSCTGCQFLGRCTTDKNGRSLSRHPYEKELRQMRQKLNSESGKAIYGKRKYTVEPPFGHIKSIMGFTSFMLRGKQKVTGEFKLISIAHNLRKIWLYLKVNQENLAGMCPVLEC